MDQKINTDFHKPPIVITGLALAVLTWVGDSVFDAVFLNRNGIINNLLPNEAEKIWTRIFTISIITGFGFYLHKLFSRIKKCHAKMEKATNDWAATFDAINDPVFIHDAQFRITRCNLAYQKAAGLHSKDILGRPYFKVYPKTEGCLKKCAKAAETWMAQTDEITIDDRVFSIRIYPARNLDENGISTIHIMNDITENKRTEATVKHQLELLKALRKIDMSINASMDLRATLEVVLDQITSILGVDAADMLLYNRVSQRLEYGAGRGFRGRDAEKASLHIAEGYAGKVALDGRTSCLPALKGITPEFVRQSLIRNEEFVSYCCVPMISKGDVLGVIDIFQRSPLDATPEFLDIAEAMALQAAIAIDNARLFNNLHRSNVELSLAYETTIEGWSSALDLRDKETEGHSRRVTELTMRIAREMGFGDEELLHMRRGALLHDIGKMGVPDAILLKPGALTQEEWDAMKKHPRNAYELLSHITYLHHAIDIPYCHHEKWDGTGYPRGLKGEDIPVAARIFAVADVWDALRSDRPYRKAWPVEQVLEHIKSLSGNHFDPKIAELFLKMQAQDMDGAAKPQTSD
ncbi:MAG: HD domain-containing protein [Deltaproteobacteria bacterium]|nr:HD domain-containing protein [Deltaproteobacteria bacterium]